MKPITINTAVALLTMSAGASVALAQMDAATPLDANTGVTELIEMLDSDSFFERDAARSALDQHTALSNQRLHELIRNTDLSPEQQIALETILYSRFTTRGVGGIGIQFANVQPAGSEGLTVTGVVDEFPAIQQNLVRTGDIFARVDGVDLAIPAENNGFTGSASETVQKHVFSRKPGDLIPVRILRTENGKQRTLDIELPLGDMSSHSRPSISRNVLQAAFRLYLERETGLSTADTSEIPIDSEMWPLTMRSSDLPRVSLNKVVGGPAPLVTVRNTFDPFSPVRDQDAIRRQFVESSKMPTLQERNKIAIKLQPQQQLNNIVVQRRIRVEDLRGIAGRPGARTQPLSPEPVIDEIVRLRTDLSGFERTLVQTDNPGARSRIQERIDEASVRIDALQEELRSRLGETSVYRQRERAAEQQRQREQPIRMNNKPKP